MKTFLFAAALTLLLAAPFADAQQQLPPGKWWRRPETIRVLALSAEQQDRLDEVFRRKADELIDTKADVDKLQVSLRGELDRAQLRRAEIQRIAQRLNEARSKLFETELMMLVDMREVLTEVQWDKMRNHLERMKQQRREEPMNMRPRRRP